MPTLTQRSIVEASGGDMIIITLPKAWQDYYKLEKGSKVEVVDCGDHLLVRRVTETSEGPSIKRLMLQAAPEVLSFPVPRAWIERNSLKKGDKVDVVANGELTIRPVKEIEGS